MEVFSVLVTGANRGIGLEFVRQFIALPKPPKYIFATFRSEKTAEALEKISLSSKECHIIKLKMDVTNSGEIEACRKIVEETVGESGLTLLINNAGILVKDSFPDTSDENMLSHFHCNVMGPVNCIKAFLPLLKKSADRSQVSKKKSLSRGGIVCISGEFGSITNLVADVPQFPGLMAYRVSKAALNMATRVMATTMKDQDILMVLICPGWVKTDMGTERGMLEVSDSVACMMQTMKNLDESHHGLFVNRSGKIIPF